MGKLTESEYQFVKGCHQQLANLKYFIEYWKKKNLPEEDWPTHLEHNFVNFHGSKYENLLKEHRKAIADEKQKQIEKIVSDEELKEAKKK